MSKTKIIATLGPSSSSLEVIEKLILNGADIFRINTKYGSKEEYLDLIKNINLANKKLKKKTKILFDIKNQKLIPFLREIKFDYLAIAFAESKQQINAIKKKLNNNEIKIISKIETKKGFKNLDDLINCSFGIMVARGDLGENVPLQKLPIYQKEIIKECNKKNVFVITATEMLLSMQFNKLPTRAEVCDVANAILDGSNAIMLSEETTIGKYPDLAVQFMDKIILETEKWNKKFIC
jgi:pyruvate kinase